MVVHWRSEELLATPRVGFVVSKAVGNSVTRHAVQRRLRHLVAQRIDALVPGTLVVRALPPSASADSQSLGRDLDACLGRVLERSAA
jgi:ribonuclease P protein component